MRLVIKFDFLDTFLNMKIKIRTAVISSYRFPLAVLGSIRWLTSILHFSDISPGIWL
ncbi:hypothetical protein NSS70_01535 [Aeribacillus sp. FSL K6-2848]|uniref:hypothetical protein n=1 Tax=Aeribacillus sp. FSL K6-2848 TaxID=2954612 RepID=UPI002872379A|nr:hypothetical protein [Aeribacillus pallidus]